MFNHRLPASPLVLSSFLAIFSVTSAAFAQVPGYRIGDAVRDTRPQEKEPIRPPEAPAPVIIQETQQPMSMADNEKILIKDFRVVGADFLPADEVAALFDSYRNRELTMTEINQAANRVTVLCRSKGYIVARAYVPKQDIQNGVLVIQVIPGKYGSFQLKNKSLVNDETLQSMFDAAKAHSEIITQENLERPMLLMNDMPGTRMPLVSIAPGKTPGTSDFIVEAEPAERVAGYATMDNYGSRYVGKNRYSAGLDINSPFGIGDRISLYGVTTAAAGLQNARAAYGFPIASDGLRAEVAATRTTYKLGDAYSDLDSTGTADSIEGKLSYPLKRTREDSIYLSMLLAARNLDDKVGIVDLDVSKKIRSATFNVQRETFGSLLGFNSYFNVTGSYTAGDLSFDDPEQEALNKAGPNSVGSYSKVNLNFTGNVAFDAKWSLNGTLSMQQSLGKSLDGLEQLSLSGVSGIKSYPDGVLGDNGYLAGIELRRSLPSVAGYDQMVGLFGNYGEVRAEHPELTLINRLAIGDFGLSYYLTGSRFFGQLQVAHTTGRMQATETYNGQTKGLVTVGVRF